jgi:hypothetical protein
MDLWRLPVAKNNAGDGFEREREREKVEQERSEDCERTLKRSKKECPHKRKKS